MGLQPVDGSYFQNVPMIGYETDPSSVALSFTGPTARSTPEYLDGYVLNAGDPEASWSAGNGEVVFVGYGINAPENQLERLRGRGRAAASSSSSW